MTRYSLRLRLLVGGAVAVFVALAIAWVAMTLLFERQLEQRVAQELRRDALQLVAGLSIDTAGMLQASQKPTDPRFSTPAGGLYWQVSGNGKTQRSRSLWDQVLAPSTSAGPLEWKSRFVAGPFGHRLFSIERVIQPPGSDDRVLVQVALDEEELRVARNEFGAAIALFLFILWAFLAGAAWIQVELGLRPLARLRRELAALRHNASERLSADYPREVEPLTRAINDLASAREADVKRARQRAADLAHGLKTPLAALAAQSRLIRAAGAGPQAAVDGLDRAVAAAAAAVEAELARARAAASRHTRRGEQAPPLAVTQRLILVLEHTDKGMQLDYALDIPDSLRLAIAEEDLSEILGPLLENAVRFARRRIRVSSVATDEDITLSVEDDGPGINTADAAEAMVRGVRLDQAGGNYGLGVANARQQQAGGGYGLGLAIAREMVEATGGTIALGVSSLGGLRVNLRWHAPQIKNPNSEKNDTRLLSGAWAWLAALGRAKQNPSAAGE